MPLDTNLVGPNERFCFNNIYKVLLLIFFISKITATLFSPVSIRPKLPNKPYQIQSYQLPKINLVRKVM